MPKGWWVVKAFSAVFYLALTEIGSFLLIIITFQLVVKLNCIKNMMKVTVRNLVPVLEAKHFLKFYALVIFSSSH